MMKFTLLVIASVLAPGLHSAVIENRPDIVHLPFFLGVESRPELRPEIIPEVEPVSPELVSINPCDACFQYMTALIDQLTDVAVPETPEVPEIGLPEPELPRPLPESINPEDLRPLPLPVAPEVEVNPIPLPVAPEVEVNPIPLPVAPEVEVNPIPLPEVGFHPVPQVPIRPIPFPVAPVLEQ